MLLLQQKSTITIYTPAHTNKASLSNKLSQGRSFPFPHRNSPLFLPTPCHRLITKGTVSPTNQQKGLCFLHPLEGSTFIEFTKLLGNNHRQLITASSHPSGGRERGRQ